MIKPIIKKIYFELQYLSKKVKPEKPIILMYHRVATESSDPHLLCVSPENFEEHIKYLKQNKKIVALSKITKKDCDKNSVAITFDDGYLDNLTNALPILKKYDAPATIFITAGLLGKKFPWDNQESTGRCMTKEELIELSKEPLIEIGAHTMTHPRLSILTKEKQEYEITESKKLLKEIIRNDIKSFAYPFGDFNNETMEIAKNNFKQTCSTKAGSTDKKTNISLLPRYITRNWNKNKFIRKINVFK